VFFLWEAFLRAKPRGIDVFEGTCPIRSGDETHVALRSHPTQPRTWFFDILECVRRLLLTGMMVSPQTNGT
jgi:hypothetical protein